MRTVNKYETVVRKLELQIEKERYRVCSEAKNKYIPNGLLTSIPANWNCSIDESKLIELSNVRLKKVEMGHHN